jgi:hypothetical protein
MIITQEITSAIDILEREGYYVKNDSYPFAVYPNKGVMDDPVKSFVCLNSCRTHDGSVIRIRFHADICRMRCGEEDESCIPFYREVAEYLTHMCDVADELNALNVTLYGGGVV